MGERRFIGFLVLAVAALVAGVGLAEGSSTASTTESIWERVLEVDAYGGEWLSVEVSEAASLPGGVLESDDLSSVLQAGNHALVLDAYQAEDDLISYYTASLEPIEAVPMTDEERLEAYVEVYPNATGDDLAAFQERLARSAQIPTSEQKVSTSLLEWMEDPARESDTVQVFLRLTDAPPLDLPELAVSLLETEPAFSLEAMESRLLAIEERKAEVLALQSDLVDTLVGLGATIVNQYWTRNILEAEIDADTLGVLLADPDVLAIEEVPETVTEANSGREIREATQIEEMLDAGLDGSTSSGRSSYSDIYIGIIDTDIDEDHPAWNDATGSSRLVALQQADSSCTTLSSSATSSMSHGTFVAGQALADLLDGQDTGETATPEQRTGMTTESVFAFFDLGTVSSGFACAIAENVDIVNYSGGSTTYCDPEDAISLAANDLYLDNIFFVKGAGNNYHDDVDGDGDYDEADCTIGAPGAAAGTFTVGGADPSAANLKTADLFNRTSRGGDAHGRSLVDLSAPAGRGCCNTDYDDAYHPMWYGVSFATPVITGAAADFKHHLINMYGTGTANQVGYMYAFMLLMGDGELEDGTKATARTAYDTVWGAGRARMRMFNAAGMDAPWRRRATAFNVADGNTYSFKLDPDGSGTNRTIPSDVEWLRVAAWWYEPNLALDASGSPIEDPAEIRLRICKDGGSGCYVYETMDDNKARLWLGNVIGGDAWTIYLDGVNVPASTDTNDPLYGLQQRRVYLAFYWEDRDRDDADGPDTGIY